MPTKALETKKEQQSEECTRQGGRWVAEGQSGSEVEEVRWGGCVMGPVRRTHGEQAKRTDLAAARLPGLKDKQQSAKYQHNRGASSWRQGWNTSHLEGSRLHLLQDPQFFKSRGRETPVILHPRDRRRAKVRTSAANRLQRAISKQQMKAESGFKFSPKRGFPLRPFPRRLRGGLRALVQGVPACRQSERLHYLRRRSVWAVIALDSDVLSCS